MSDTWIALIRGIGPVTHGKMSMADLRKAAERAGFGDVRTLLATGNLLFTSDLDEAALSARLVDILAGFDLANDVILRRPDEFAETLAANPFAGAASDRPNHLLVHFLPGPAPQRVEWDGPERIATFERAAFLDYANGVGSSKLSPARLERLMGQTGTARNWNTCDKLLAACA